MADTDTHRVLVRVQGAPAPVHTSRWMSPASADHARRNHEAMIRDRGSSHVVEVQTRPSFPEWLAIALGRPVRDDDRWGVGATILREAWDRGDRAEAWRDTIAAKGGIP